MSGDVGRPADRRSARERRPAMWWLLCIAVVVVSAAAVVAVASVVRSGATPAPTGSIEWGVQNASSDFEREVFRDGEITGAEYDEAVQRYLACMSDRGVEVEITSQGDLYQYMTRSSDADFSAASNDCKVGTKGLIEPVFAAQIDEREDHPE